MTADYKHDLFTLAVGAAGTGAQYIGLDHTLSTAIALLTITYLVLRIFYLVKNRNE